MLKKMLLSVVFLLGLVNVYAEPVLKGVGGEEIPFSTLHGKWVLINYWASWCEPCLAEIPELNRFYKLYKNNKDVVMFGVNFDGLPVEQQKILVQELNIHYPTLSKDPRPLFHLGAISGVPVTFIFNPEGKLAATLYGSQTAEGLKRALT